MNGEKLLPLLLKIKRIKRIEINSILHTYLKASVGNPYMSSDEEKVERLLEFGGKIEPRELFPSLEEGAAVLIEENPFAFALAAALDRGLPAEIIWTIPYYLREEVGELNPKVFASKSIEEIREILENLPKKPRYINAAPRTVKELSEIVQNEYDGDASRIWTDEKAKNVKKTFRRIHGVGSGISSMVVLLLERCFDIHFADMGHREINVKPDTHVVRVFHRLGFISEPTCEGTLESAKDLNLEFPGALDSATWIIGKRWCDPTSPNCKDCPMEDLCPKKGVD